eukprot:366301-Chlamydomonas_euryale.AAC.49
MFCTVGCVFSLSCALPDRAVDPAPYNPTCQARTALLANTLACLPTGLGKTLIAAVVMFNFYRCDRARGKD